MDYRRYDGGMIDGLFELQTAYKLEIGEDAPDSGAKERLKEAVDQEKIAFYGAFDGERPVGTCSVTVGFSTFDYAPSGVFEDFYIMPGYRGKGIARKLVQFAREASGVSSLTVGCADCDVEMYKALGFTVELGNLLAFD